MANPRVGTKLGQAIERLKCRTSRYDPTPTPVTAPAEQALRQAQVWLNIRRSAIKPMFQDNVTSQENYDRFITRVRENGRVFGLQSPNGGWAVCPSNEFENTSVMVFWSDRAYAARHAKEGWKHYTPAEISIDDFIDCWLQGMNNDGSLVGPNWDAHLCGLEIEPIEVARLLTEE